VAARAFEPFFTTKETGKGSGLGLAMVYGFVKQSGGHVKIYSEPGIGTTVKIFLPQLEGLPVEEPAPPTQESRPTGQETILLVEDEEDVRQLACRVLDVLGYRILPAGDGPTALAVLDENPDIALLFTDVVLPGGMTGPQIAREAQARRPDLKVMYTSGYTGNAVQHLESIEGHVRLLSKPYAIDELAQMVRATLDGA
jgi:CheY-like chemotaxis protein